MRARGCLRVPQEPHTGHSAGMRLLDVLGSSSPFFSDFPEVYVRPHLCSCVHSRGCGGLRKGLFLSVPRLNRNGWFQNGRPPHSLRRSDLAWTRRRVRVVKDLRKLSKGSRSLARTKAGIVRMAVLTRMGAGSKPRAGATGFVGHVLKHKAAR